jgi:hypothetical protein
MIDQDEEMKSLVKLEFENVCGAPEECKLHFEKSKFDREKRPFINQLLSVSSNKTY